MNLQGSPLDAATVLHEIGFNIIPLGSPTSDLPLWFKQRCKDESEAREKWPKTPRFSWKKYQSAPADEAEITSWFAGSFADSNIGIIGDKVFIVDADSAEAVDWCEKHLPYTPMRVVTSKGKHFYFKNAEGAGNFSNKAVGIDGRGVNGYVVGPTSRHASGHVYALEMHEEISSVDDLPPLDAASIAKVVGLTNLNGRAASSLPKDLNPGNLGLSLAGVQPANPAEMDEEVSEGGRNEHLAKLIGGWIKKGLGLEELLLLAQGVNSAQFKPPLAKEEVAATVHSVLKTHLRKHPEDHAQTVSVIYRDEAEEAVFPDFILRPGGLLESMIQYVDANAAVAHPVFSLAGALVTLGTVMGQRYMTETGLRTNIYCLAIGESGSGKDAPQKVLPNLLYASNDLNRLVGPTHLTSAAAGWSHLHKQNVSMFMLDEIGMTLAQCNGKTGSTLADLPQLFTDVFSRSNSVAFKSYSDYEKRIVIERPHLSLYGASTPDMFWENMGAGAVESGFIPRFLIFESNHAPLRPKAVLEFHNDPSLLAALERVRNVPVGPPFGNLHPNCVTPNLVRKTSSASELFDKFAAHAHHMRTDYSHPDLGAAKPRAMWGRAAEHAHKLALIHACSLLGPDVIGFGVGEESAEWACETVNYLIETCIAHMAGRLAVNAHHRRTLDIKRVIASKATKERPGATKREIMRALHLTAREFDEAIQSMTISGEIVHVDAEKNSRRGRPHGGIYCVCG